MNQSFFELSSPKDMLEKAIREYGRMSSDLNVDTVFNFFVTVHHIYDYVKASGKLDPHSSELNKIHGDINFKDDDYYRDFVISRLICNSGKHLNIKRIETRHSSSLIAQALSGETMLGEGDKYRVIVDGEAIEVKELGARLIQKWKKFLIEKGI